MHSQGGCHALPRHGNGIGSWGTEGEPRRWITDTGQCPGVNHALPVFQLGWAVWGARVGYGQVLSVDISGGHFIQ